MSSPSTAAVLDRLCWHSDWDRPALLLVPRRPASFPQPHTQQHGGSAQLVAGSPAFRADRGGRSGTGRGERRPDL